MRKSKQIEIKMKKLIKILLIAVLAVTFAACKTSKSATKPVSSEVEEIAHSHKLSPDEMIRKLQKAQPAFTRAYVKKMSVYVDFKGRQLDVKATCKIVSDSAIHLSIQPFFGVELFKLEMTPKSLILVDKPNKTYYESNYSIFNNTLGVIVNFEGVQSLISNRMFVPGKTVIQADDFIWKDGKSKNVLELYNYNINEEVTAELSLVRIIEVMLGAKENENVMTAKYADFKNFDGVLFPEKIMLDASNSRSKAVFHFTMEEISFDKPFNMQPINLERYNQGDIRSFFRK